MQEATGLPGAESGTRGSTVVWGNGQPESLNAGELSSPLHPSLELRSKKGIVLLDELEGRVLVLHFWASWCAPCRTELPAFVAFARSSEWTDLPDVRSILITLDNYLGEGQGFLDELGLGDETLYHDAKWGVLSAITGGQGVPVTVVFRKHDRRSLATFPASDWSLPEVRHSLLRVLRSGGGCGENEETESCME